MPLQITFIDNEINNYLRVDTGIDAEVIDAMKDAALIEAEAFLNTDFNEYDEEGNLIAQNEAPATVKLWVMSRMAQLYEGRGQRNKPDFTLLKPHRVYPFGG